MEETMECPACKKELTIEKTKGIEINRCPSCSGMWLDKGELNKLTDKEDKMVEYNTVDHDSNLHGDKHPKRKCPKCGNTMKKVDLLSGTPIIYDYCQYCKGFWLDNKELEETKEYLKKQKNDETLVVDPIFTFLGISAEEPESF
jgi:Zn-finger nucleic acid-binding protein